MRSRTAVLALSLALFALAAVPMAKAETQTITQRELSSNGAHASYDLDSLVALQIQVPQPAEVRIFRADSAGRKLLVVQVADLPNPAAHRSTRSGRAYRSSSQLAFNDPGSERIYAERLGLLPFSSSPAIASDHRRSQRITSGLRAAALIGTLVQGRHFKL
jgi:hypothetical protein